MLAFAPLDAAVGVASHAVEALATAIAPLAGGAATAVAIVLFTVAVRLLIAPLTVAQVRGERGRATLAPQVGELRRRYGTDPDRLQRELLDLYRSTGSTPLAGCLPALLQAPFFLVMYRCFSTENQAVLAGQLAGVPLGHQLTDGLAGAAGPVWGVLLAALVALAWLASRRMRRATAGGSALPEGSGDAAGAAGAALVGRILPLLPYATVPVALVLPLAGLLYLVTTTAFTALEHTVLRRGRATSSPALDRNS
jgi:YidC/Oxa1 family membrane protein insertase